MKDKEKIEVDNILGKDDAVHESAQEETESENTKGAEDKKTITDPGEVLKLFSKGALTLATPIKAGGENIEKLYYDFSRLTGLEYVAAMDSDNNTNIYIITNKQALMLFAATAAKETKGIDSVDIIERIGINDSVKAVQLAQLFFRASARVGNSRISKE